MYALLYNPSLRVEFLHPVMSLDQLIDELNLFAWQKNHSSYQHNLLAKAVRVNWIVHDLKTNSIQKPFLINEKWKIITGDTRLMAIQFHPEIATVPVICTVPSCRANRFADFSIIHSIDHLAKKLCIGPDQILYNEDWTQQELSWIEFAYQHTAHHLHDEPQRYRMMINYLKSQPLSFKFSRNWFQESIDWINFDNLSGH